MSRRNNLCLAGFLPLKSESVCVKAVLFCFLNTFISHFCRFCSIRGMVVIKGRRPDGTLDDADGYDTGEESDEEEGQEVPLDGTKVRD